MTGGYTLYSDSVALPANESLRQTQRQQGYYVLESFRNQPPGWWTDNKVEQTNHDTGVSYIAIRAIMDVLYSATTTCGRRKRHRNKSTLTPGENGKLVKSIPSQQKGSETNEDYQPVTDHPIARRIERPNEIETFGEILAYLALQNRLTGVAPLWTVPNEDGKPVELWTLPTALTTPLWQRTPEFPKGAWRVQPYYATGGMGYLPNAYAASGMIVPGEEIKRFMDPHPWFKWDGKAPLAAGAFQLDVLEMIDQARWAAFDHGVTLDAVMQVDGFDERQIDRIEAKMEAKHQGARNHRRFMVVSGPMGTQAKMNLQTMSNSPREMDFNQSWEQMVGMVLALFGVPKSVAGLAMAGSYSELYAALRQFYQRQKAYVLRLSEFLTKALAWPYCRFPGEYRIQIDLPTLDDPDLQEKQLGTDLQYDTILYNEARQLRNRPPVPGGDVPASIFVEMAKQKFAPEPEPPPMPGMDAGAMGGDMGAAPDDPQSIMDGVTAEALEEIGVPDEGGEEAAPGEAPIMKATATATPKSGILRDKRGRRYRIENGKRVPIGENKWADRGGREQAKPAATHGGQVAHSQADEYQRLRAEGASHREAMDTLRGISAEPHKPSGPRFATRNTSEEVDRQLGRDTAPTTSPFPSRIGGEKSSGPQPSYPEKPAPVKGSAKRAASTPAGKEVLARAKEWAATQAEKHADRVAAHLGITRGSAVFLLRTTIEKLCREALAGGTAEASHVSPEGKRVTLKVKRKDKGPTSGAVPRPENKAGAGSRPPMAKAMSAFADGFGAELLAPPGSGRVVKLKRPKTRRRRVKFLEKLVKGLPT